MNTQSTLSRLKTTSSLWNGKQLQSTPEDQPLGTNHNG